MQAERAHIASTVLGGADVVTLSSEIATSKYLVEYVAMQWQVITVAEADCWRQQAAAEAPLPPLLPSNGLAPLGDALATTACRLARQRCLVAVGAEAAGLAACRRPGVPILALRSIG